MLSDSCQAWWYDYFYCNRRGFHDGNGFIIIPGIISSQWNLTNFLDTPWVTPTNNLLFENTTLYNSIKNQTLNTKKPEVDTTSYFGNFSLSCECNGSYAPFDKIYKKSRICYKVKLKPGTKDCSSVYSVHIQKPDGSWMLQAINSTTYNFCPDQLGTYQIGIRQDYKGDSVQYGEVDIHVSSLYYCQLIRGRCDQIPIISDCNKKILKLNFRNIDSKYSIIYKNSDNQLKHTSSLDALNFNYITAADISFNNEFIDVRFDVNGNSYFFSNFNTHGVITKFNNLGIMQWENQFNGNIIKVIESASGYEFLMSNNESNNVSIRSIDFNGNVIIKCQSISSAVTNTRLASFSNETFVVFDISQNKLVIKDINSGNEIVRYLPVAFIVKSIDFTDDNKILVSGDFVGQLTFENDSYNSEFTNIAFFLYDNNGAVINSFSYRTDQNQFLDGVSLNGSGDVVYYGHYILANGSNYYDPCHFIYKFRFDSSLIPRNKNTDTEHIMEVFPNPFLEDLNIKITSGYDDSGELLLFNSLGKIITNNVLNLTKGENIIKLDVDKNLFEGMYFIGFKSRVSGKESISKIIKLR